MTIYVSSLLSAYKGLKQPHLKRRLQQLKSLLSAYKGLKRDVNCAYTGTATFWFIKCL